MESSLKYDKTSQKLKNEMLSIEQEKNHLERSLIEENEQKESVLKILQHTESFSQKNFLSVLFINIFLRNF